LPLRFKVYTQTPGEVGKANVLLCHVSGFHPPQISIELLKNGQSLSGSLQTDLAFEENWQYYLTKYVSFTPTKGDNYACRVTHMGESNTYNWEPDM
uniref:Beta-2-microglobulin n=1 Tax=Tetraodon nigroviridis TaxID=99883 RepID=H3BWT6_TETNG